MMSPEDPDEHASDVDETFERKEDGSLILPPSMRPYVETLARSLDVHGPETRDALWTVGDWIEHHAEEYVFEMPTGESLIAVHADAVRSLRDEADAHDIRAALDLGERQRVTKAHRARYALELGLSQLFEDSDVSTAFAPVPLRAADGVSFVIVVGTQGYSFSEVTVEWHGPVRTFTEFREALSLDGWIVQE